MLKTGLSRINQCFRGRRTVWAFASASSDAGILVRAGYGWAASPETGQEFYIREEESKVLPLLPGM